MLQKMPVKNSFDEESNDDIWQNSLKFLSTLGKEEFLSTNLTSEEILYRLFNELEITVYDEIIIQDQCRCSEEKIKFAIKNLSKKELTDIADENGNVKVVCEFCKTERIFPSWICNQFFQNNGENITNIAKISRRPNIIPAHKINFPRSGIDWYDHDGPIISHNPGPTFPIAEAAPEIAVTKSSPNPPNKLAITAKEIIYKKKKPITDSATFSGIGFWL